MHLPFWMGYLKFSMGIMLFLLRAHQWERLVRIYYFGQAQPDDRRLADYPSLLAGSLRDYFPA